MKKRRQGAALGLSAAIALTLAACATPLSAPADTGRATTQTSAAPQSRQIRPIDPTATAVRPVFAPSPTPESGVPLPTPVAPVLSPVPPEMPTLTLPPRPPLDAGSQAAVGAVIGTATAQAAAAQATTQALPAQEIIMRDLTFSPSALTVRPGTTIIWRNQDRVQHQVTGGEFDSGRIQGGFQWAQIIGKPGLYQFVCSFHPTMRADVTVSPDDTRPVHLGS